MYLLWFRRLGGGDEYARSRWVTLRKLRGVVENGVGPVGVRDRPEPRA